MGQRAPKDGPVTIAPKPKEPKKEIITFIGGISSGKVQINSINSTRPPLKTIGL
jgi:hypothetical protein